MFFSHVPVVADGRLVGIASRRDLMYAMTVGPSELVALGDDAPTL
ncbi:CBS domain-containing protein [Rhizobium sp. RAF56]